MILCLGLNGFFSASFGQNPEWNLNFELWEMQDTTPDLWHDTTVIENREGLFPPQWHFRPDHIPEGTGLGRTTDATDGNFAVTLSGFYSYEVMRIISGANADRSGWPIDFKPQSLIGDYKAILLGTCDSLRTYVNVFLTNYNSIGNYRDTIGEASIVLNETLEYEQFELHIDYSNELQIPDTVIIVLAKERFGFDSPPACLECSHVFFDNLNLTTPLSGQESPIPKNNIELFPNPTSQSLFLKTDCENCQFNITIIGTSGQLVKVYNGVGNEFEINTNDIGKGIYLVKIEERQSRNFFIKKLVIE